MLIAPYNNSMRLGQGFNSYTQQICLDQAVTIDPSWRPTVAPEQISLNHDEINPRENSHSDKEDQNYELVDRLADWQKQNEPAKPKQQPEEPAATADEGDDKGADGKKKKKLIELDGELARKLERDVARAELIRAQRDVQSASETNATRRELLEGSGETGAIVVPPWVKPQIVTYSSRFVDKISDVTDAMNISGSVSIKTATIGGKANGSYVDSDKFKSSDINYHLQVRVTNQIHNAPNYSIFNDTLAIDKSRFAEVYGDSFISGWEEGGELNAIISMKVMDKAKIWEVKASLEAQLNTGAIAGEVKGSITLDKNNLSKETETTIAVSWSGGGSIKDPGKDWSITTLKKAAAAFPDYVAITPQRTYAILTKYTALADFQAKKKEFSPLAYENAGIYTGALLDSYMEYKSLWKQISIATYELEGNRATIEMGTPSTDLFELARIKALPQAQAQPSNGMRQIEEKAAAAAAISDAGSDGVHQLNVKSTEIALKKESEDVTQIDVFPDSFAGLIKARKVCRFEMAKIVNEVDLVARNPDLATDTRRDSFFLNPMVYKQLLPIVRSLSPESEALGARDPNAALLLGYLQPTLDERSLPSLTNLTEGIELDSKLAQTLTKLRTRAHDYRLQGCAGRVSGIHTLYNAFNDLQLLNGTYRPISISAWSKNNKLQGLLIRYASGQVISHGITDGEASHKLELATDGSEAITEVSVSQDSKNEIASICLATSLLNVLDTSISTDADRPAAPKPAKTFTWTKPDEQNWSLRGFFGFSRVDNSEAGGFVSFASFGVIWGKDSFIPVPMRPMRPALAKSFLRLGPRLQKNVRDIVQMYSSNTSNAAFKQWTGKFLMGDSVTAGSAQSSAATDASKPNTTTEGTQTTEEESGPPTETIKAFNALGKIDIDWKIKSIAFFAEDNALAGLVVKYTNGEEIVHGSDAQGTHIWTADVKRDLIVAKLTAGKLEADEADYIDTVEFVQSAQGGDLPAWPLNTSMLRYLGQTEKRVSIDTTELVECAPKLGKNPWSIRGFYGEEQDGVIVRLGVIWGRG